MWYIDQPVEARKPVGYQPEFLADYCLNETWYLSASFHLQLHRMDRINDVDEPAGTGNRNQMTASSWATASVK